MIFPGVLAFVALDKGGWKGGVGLDAVRHPARLEILLRHLGSALRRLAPLTAAMDRLEDADQKICPAR
jgi:hypothetical protein